MKLPQTEKIRKNNNNDKTEKKKTQTMNLHF
jgi:hypothetical protein